MNKRTIVAIAGTALVAGVLGPGTPAALAGGTTGTPLTAAMTLTAGTAGGVTVATAAPRPPKGARAVVRVSPNPTARRGQKVRITGHCGGGRKLNAVLSGFGDRPVLENVRIVDADPKGFTAEATLSRTIGNGVGPVFVDCGGEAGVTLLVTHV